MMQTLLISLIWRCRRASTGRTRGQRSPGRGRRTAASGVGCSTSVTADPARQTRGDRAPARLPQNGRGGFCSTVALRRQASWPLLTVRLAKLNDPLAQRDIELADMTALARQAELA